MIRHDSHTIRCIFFGIARACSSICSDILTYRTGYRWLPRCQKPAVSSQLASQRVKFAKQILRLSAAALREKISLSLDGVVLSMPPTDAIDRKNYCVHGITHMYRQPGESAHPDLAGANPYAAQIPVSRCFPLWGGISAGGFAAVVWHENKKLNTGLWVRALRAGKLKDAIRSLKPVKARGPWTVLADGEKFLWSVDSTAAYERDKIALWRVPPSSPDLNPVEKMWGWVRKQLRAMDLADLKAKRPVPGRLAYKTRIRNLLKTKRAQTAATKFALSLKTVCKAVVRAKGARTRH